MNSQEIALRIGFIPRNLIAAILLSACWSAEVIATEVTVCVDPESPPYVFWQRDAQQNKTNVLTGSTIELIQTAFEKIGATTKFVSLPWARCLRSVELGTINFAADAYYDEERAKIFLYSAAYNQFTPQVFFMAKRSINVHTKADLKKYRGCGVIGFSYAHYGLKEKDLDLGVSSYQSLFDKLKAGRCDYFVEELETITGQRLIGADYLADQNFAHGSIDDAVGPKEYLVTAKNSAFADLIPKFNSALSSLVSSGQVAKITAKYMSNIPQKPSH